MIDILDILERLLSGANGLKARNKELTTKNQDLIQQNETLVSRVEVLEREAARTTALEQENVTLKGRITNLETELATALANDAADADQITKQREQIAASGDIQQLRDRLSQIAEELQSNT